MPHTEHVCFDRSLSQVTWKFPLAAEILAFEQRQTNVGFSVRDDELEAALGKQSPKRLGLCPPPKSQTEPEASQERQSSYVPSVLILYTQFPP